VVALAHGLAFALAVAASSRLSGGPLNPAITAGAVLAGRMPATVGTLYAGAQVVGAVAAAVLLKLVVPGAAANGLGTHVLGAKVAPEAAVVVEGVVTFALVLAFLATASVARATAPPVLGAVIALGHLFAMPLTGASMNPARSFGPALVAGAWTAHWVYWLGPLLGAGLAALAWKWAFADGRETEPRIVNGDDAWRRAAHPTR
jgi:aquaporin TIP